MRTEPVVLVHGWGGSFRNTWQVPGWEALLQEAGRTVIAVDLLGHGTAPKPHEPEAYADLTTRIADALPADGQVDAVGFSLGAATLLQLASRQPGRFGRIVVGGVGANLFRDDAAGRRSIVAAVRGDGDPTDVRSQLFAQYASQPGNDPEALALVLERQPARGALGHGRFAAISCPVLVCMGDNDFAGPADPLVEALPDATLVVLKNTDHFATPESFGFIDAALEFLEAVPG
jgi:pimeloyl-ACP methyl ester carboxylesterase